MLHRWWPRHWMPALLLWIAIFGIMAAADDDDHGSDGDEGGGGDGSDGSSGNPSCEGTTNIGFSAHWISAIGGDDEIDGKKVTLGDGTQNLTLPSCIANSTPVYVDQNTLELFKRKGMGLLRNGTLVYFGETGECFETATTNNHPYGTGSGGAPLTPFVSVMASNEAFLNKTYEVPGLKGLLLPNDIEHNGCVRVDGLIYGATSCHASVFIGTYYNRYVADKIPSQVVMTEAECTPIDPGKLLPKSQSYTLEPTVQMALWAGAGLMAAAYLA